MSNLGVGGENVTLPLKCLFDHNKLRFYYVAMTATNKKAVCNNITIFYLFYYLCIRIIRHATLLCFTANDDVFVYSKADSTSGEESPDVSERWRREM